MTAIVIGPSVEPMKILITGVSGFIGGHLARTLAADGHQITGIGGRKAPAGLDLERIDYIGADTTRPGAWQDKVASADVLINLAGRTIARRWTSAYKKEIHASRIQTTRNLVAAMAPGGRQVLLSASAVGYYGDGGETELTEAAPAGEGFLAELAAGWEQAAQGAADRGARVCRMRFGVVLGTDGGALAQMLPAFRRGLGGPLGGGRQWFSWIHVHDLVSAVVYLMTATDIDGPVNLVAPQPVRQRDLARDLGRRLGRPAFVPAPGPMLRLVLGELAATLLASQRVIPQRLAAANFKFRYPDIDSALAALVG
jgi:uncharacterized protein (TIGR01777 family)